MSNTQKPKKCCGKNEDLDKMKRLLIHHETLLRQIGPIIEDIDKRLQALEAKNKSPIIVPGR